jgi:hypothetical protein
MDAERDEVEDANDAFRTPVIAPLALTSDVPLIVDLGNCSIKGLEVSPARSASVFLFGSNSFARKREVVD